MFAYLVTNLVNGKQYIGITANTVAQRWKQHLKSARKGSKRALHAAIRKHGQHSFRVEEIAGARTWEDLCALEVVLVEQYQAMKNGYNMTLGGEGVELSEEGKLRHREAIKAAMQRPEVMANLIKALSSPEYKAKKNASLKSTYSQPEVRAVQSDRAKRQFESPEAHAKASAAQKIATRTPQARAKRSLNSKRMWSDPESREKMLKAIASPNTRAKMSESHKRYFKSPEARAKHSQIQRRAQGSVEARAKMAASQKRSWAARVRKRADIEISWQGTTMKLDTLSEKTGMRRQILWWRIVRSGWSVERALTTPVSYRRKAS